MFTLVTWYFLPIPFTTGLLCSCDQKILFKLFNFATSVHKHSQAHCEALTSTCKRTASCFCDEWKRAFSTVLCGWGLANIGAFCLSMRENRSVRLQMADLSGVVSFVMVFMKNMDWIFVRSLRIRVNSTQVRVLVLLQFNFRQNSWSFV
jgi:hypothetical protein